MRNGSSWGTLAEMRVFVATPLHHSVRQPFTFKHGLSIRKLPTILWEKAVVTGFISERDRELLSEDRYWLTAEDDYSSISPDTGDELYDKARRASWAFQLIHPIGGKHVFLKFSETAEGSDNLGALHPKELNNTAWARVSAGDDQQLFACFDHVYEGVNRAFDEQIIRLQNPLILLEHGLQLGHIYLSTMMFAMALDMLFMAGEMNNFVPRLGGFLGLDTLVLPREPYLQRQPDIKARGVLKDIYELRNIVAHGQQIPLKPYREPYTVTSVTGEYIPYEDCSYADILIECSLFILTTCLRRIMLEGMIDKVKDEDQWRQEMKLYEHRYKNAGGTYPGRKR